MNKYGLSEWGMSCGRGKYEYFSLKLRDQNGSGDYPACAVSKTSLTLRHNQIVTPDRHVMVRKLLYCGIFAQSKNCEARETAVANEWL
jgi:hypothetical protein